MCLLLLMAKISLITTLTMALTANPSLDRLSTYKVLAAFDIGTTYSGYAWSTKASPKTINLNHPWGFESNTQTLKTPTAILTDTNKDDIEFGYCARVNYKAKGINNHLYDENLKMKLYHEKKLNDSINVTSRDGEQMTLMSLIAKSIDYLYKHMLAELQKSYESVDESLIRVVITVPAIWSASAKDFMRRAANKAGINSNRLILALEPEAASLYCRTLQPTDLSSEEFSFDLPSGKRYVVIDCGGGTVDISVHEVVDSNSVKEVHCAEGGPWGGGKVNEEFEKQLCRLLGEPFIDQFKVKQPRDWFDIHNNFEYLKRTYPVDDFNIILPYSLIKAYESQGKNIENDINSFDGCEFADGRLLMSNSIVKKMFKQVIDGITNHIQNIWKDSKVATAEYAFMVGGFSESNFLLKEVTATIKNLNKEVYVLRPTSAEVAVLKGAIQFGHRPNAIVSRMSRLTYGVGVLLPFDSTIHDEDKKTTVDGEEMCDDIFSVWASKNESVSVGEKRTFTLYPYSKASTWFSATMYASEKEKVTYTTESGVKRLTSIEIPVPDSNLPKYDRAVKHDVYFGGTEIHVRIKDEAIENGKAKSDGASNEAKVPFDFYTN